MVGGCMGNHQGCSAHQQFGYDREGSNNGVKLHAIHKHYDLFCATMPLFTVLPRSVRLKKEWGGTSASNRSIPMRKRLTFVVYSLVICFIGLVVLANAMSQSFDAVVSKTKAMLGLKTPPPNGSYNISFSPDNAWFAATIMTVPLTSTLYDVRFEVGKTDGTVRWTVIDESRPVVKDILSPACVQWSRDGRFLYFQNRSNLASDWCGLVASPADLQRVDLQTAEVKALAPPLGRTLWLSADGTAVVYERPLDREPVFRDLASGQEHALHLEMGTENRILQVVWSPEGNAFILSVAIHACSPDMNHRMKYPWGDASSLIRVDTQTMDVHTLILEDSRQFLAEEWPTTDTVVVRDRDWERWNMNAETGQLTPRTK